CDVYLVSMYLFIASPILRALPSSFVFFSFTAPAPTETYTLSLHDALPISDARLGAGGPRSLPRRRAAAPERVPAQRPPDPPGVRSEEHTSELQSRSDLVCRLLLEKKKKNKI